MSLGIHDVITELVSMLGLTLVATLGGVSETRAVTQWMNGRQPQRPHALRFALQLARMISDARGDEAARAWFLGSHPQLGDQSPVIVLRMVSLEDAQAKLMAAARDFIRSRDGSVSAG